MLLRLAAGALALTLAALPPASAQEGEADGKVQVADLVADEVVTTDGTVVGVVDRLVQRIADQSLHIIVSSGGLAGFGRSQWRVPVDDVEVVDGRLRTALSQDEIRALPEWRSDNPDFIGYFGEVPLQPAEAEAE